MTQGMSRAERRRLEMQERKNPGSVEQEFKEKQFAENRREFMAEMNFLDLHFGMRFEGILDVKKSGITPMLELKRIPRKRRKLMENNLSVNNVEELRKAGFTKTVFPPKRNIWEILIGVIPYYKKRQYMKRYQDIVLKYEMLFFTFLGDQDGRMVGAMDVRAMDPRERRAFIETFKGRKHKETQDDARKQPETSAGDHQPDEIKSGGGGADSVPSGSSAGDQGQPRGDSAQAPGAGS